MNDEAAQLIRQQDALSAIGVSEATLERFVESSCLRVVTSKSGSRYFYRSELADLFQAEGALQSVPGITQSELNGPVGRIPHPAETAAIEDAALQRDEEPRDHPLVHEGKEDELSLEERYHRLRKILLVQKRLLVAREEELNDLRQQRDWLKGRVEKLEIQSDKDKVLLLSETQTIKHLLQIYEPRKSAMRTLLEYFGFAAPETKLLPNTTAQKVTIEGGTRAGGEARSSENQQQA